MALPTITVLDGAGASRAVAQRNSGRQAPGDSSAVVLSTDDLAALAAIVTAISNLASSLEIVDLGATSLAALENITVALDAASLAALESINATIIGGGGGGGTVDLSTATLAALESITVNDPGLAALGTKLDTLHADLIVGPDGATVLGKVKVVDNAGNANSALAPLFTKSPGPDTAYINAAGFLATKPAAFSIPAGQGTTPFTLPTGTYISEADASAIGLRLQAQGSLAAGTTWFNLHTAAATQERAPIVAANGEMVRLFNPTNAAITVNIWALR